MVSPIDRIKKYDIGSHTIVTSFVDVAVEVSVAAAGVIVSIATTVLVASVEASIVVSIGITIIV